MISRVSETLVTSEQVTLLSAEPEIQYVALRNIQLICQKRPGILANEIKVISKTNQDILCVRLDRDYHTQTSNVV